MKEKLLLIYIYINSSKDNSITTYKYKNIKNKRSKLYKTEKKSKKKWRQKEQRYNRKKIIAYVENNEKKTTSDNAVIQKSLDEMKKSTRI